MMSVRWQWRWLSYVTYHSDRRSLPTGLLVLSRPSRLPGLPNLIWLESVPLAKVPNLRHSLRPINSRAVLHPTRLATGGRSPHVVTQVPKNPVGFDCYDRGTVSVVWRRHSLSTFTLLEGWIVPTASVSMLSGWRSLYSFVRSAVGVLLPSRGV